MQRLTIARFDPVRTANIVAALYAVVVLVFGALFAIPFGLVALVAGERTGGAGVAAGGAIGVLFLLAIAVVFYAAIGWVLTAITCALYNWLAGRIGGIQVDVRNDTPTYGGPGIPAWASAAPTPPIASASSTPGIAPSPGTDGPPEPPAGWTAPR